MMSRRGRPLIRAILFIVRLRREVQAQHRRRSTRRRMGGLAQTAGMLRPGQGPVVGAIEGGGGRRRERKSGEYRLKRCESSRQQRPMSGAVLASRIGRELHRQQQHRNSAPSTLFLRSPTPQPSNSFGGSAHSLSVCSDLGGGETTIGGGSIEFDSFLRMPQPYQLKLDKSNQLTNVQPSAAHQLAARSLFRRRRIAGGGSLDDDGSKNNNTPSAEIAANFVNRQGSVESGEGAKGGNGAGGEGEVPRRKLKAGMVGLIGVLTAIEQNDMSALSALLSRNAHHQNAGRALGGGCGNLLLQLEEPLCSGVYALFPDKLRLLDVALMLGRGEAAQMLLGHGARYEGEVPGGVEKRREEVERVLGECERRLMMMMTGGEKGGGGAKDDDKRLQLLGSHLSILRQMLSTIVSSDQQLPPPPANVLVECVSSSGALLHFETQSQKQLSTKLPVAIRLRVEWSSSTDFSSVDGSIERNDVHSGCVLIDGLQLGQEFAFRVSLASIWGWGPSARAQPLMLRISSWAELEPENAVNLQRSWTDPKELDQLVERVDRHRQSADWQRIFPSSSNLERERKRRTGGLRHLFSASSKFVKNIQRGLFMATVFYTEERILCTVDDCLPVICVDELATGLAADDLHWLMKLSLCWDQLAPLQDSIGSSGNSSTNSQLRSRLLDAALAMHNALGVKDIGRVHHVPLVPQPGITLLVTVRLIPEGHSSEAQGLAMRWMRLDKLFRRRHACPALEFLSRELVPLLNFFESSLISLESGLYLAYLRLHSSLNSIHVMVPENLSSMLPFAQVRSNSHVTREEWAHLKMLAEAADGEEQEAIMEKAMPEQRRFNEQLAKAARTLVHDLELDKAQLAGTRLFRNRLVQLNEHISLILVMPRAEEVCQVNAGARSGDHSPVALFRGCISVPVPVFQIINLFAYQPDFLSSYCSLSIFLEHFLTINQFEQRQCLLESDARVYAEQAAQLADFQRCLEAIWRAERWISGFASVARDRGGGHRHSAFPLKRLILSSASGECRNRTDSGGSGQQFGTTTTAVESVINSNGTARPSPLLLNGGHSGPSAVAFRPLCQSPLISRSLNCSPSPLLRPAPRHHHQQMTSPLVGCSLPTNVPSSSSSSSSSHHFSTNPPRSHSSPSTSSPPSFSPLPSPLSSATASTSSTTTATSAIVRVYAAYDTGLSQKSISVRLRITSATGAAEVVRLVVLQLARLNAPRSPPTDPSQFCLVSIVGVRERRLRDEFPVLRLPPPWDKGTLCVRHIHCVGAAIELANEAAV